MRRTGTTAAAALVALATAGLHDATRGQETPPVTRADENFVQQATSGGLMEVALGTAAERAADARVRQFGRQMVADHTKTNQELMALAAQRQLAVPRAMSQVHRAAVQQIGALQGAAFDRAYLEQQEQAHRQIIAVFEREMLDGQDTALKAFATKTVPALRRHLRLVRDLLGQPAGGQIQQEPATPAGNQPI